MRAGDLVKITRTQIGAPEGTIGLIVKTHKPRNETIKCSIHEVQLYGVKLGRIRRFLSRDLEVVR